MASSNGPQPQAEVQMLGKTQRINHGSLFVHTPCCCDACPLPTHLDVAVGKQVLHQRAVGAGHAFRASQDSVGMSAAKEL